MNIVYSCGDDELAKVFVAQLDDGSQIEFVESVQPPVPRDQKWVLIISTLRGCPVGCPICDAGGDYQGKLTTEEILGQVEYLIKRRFPDGHVPIPKLKIQFARMGDPALNMEVIEALELLPKRFSLPGLLPSISTVAPVGCNRFFDELLQIKQQQYSQGRFQMQFSVHTTDTLARRRMVPIRTWTLEQMAQYGDRFFASGDRKISLNFAPAKGVPLDPSVLAPIFSPERFMIKLTPINPTRASANSGLEGLLNPGDNDNCNRVVDQFKSLGFDTILSIGELKENEIGSNCGMYVADLKARNKSLLNY